MFDWLYKQANLQSMCSITSLAMPPEYQHDLAELGRRGWPPANRHSRAGSWDHRRAESQGAAAAEAPAASSGPSVGLLLPGACEP